ncbi:MAG: methyltransferase domain-containing protein [Hyphomicrobiales bacterium]|nr:methyltransferase domain-containing protein [Hyphomicrobiales bacterium]
MPDTPQIFDRALLSQRRARAIRNVPEGIEFLLDRAVDDLAERLAAVSRSFPSALDLNSHTGAIADMLAASGKADGILRSERLPALLRPGDIGVVCDEEALPFADASLDLVVSALSLHLVNDLPGALVQIRRALKPDGLFMAVLFGGDTLNELRQAAMAAEIEVYDGASPRVAPFADVRSLGALLQRAGFALPVVDRDIVTVRYPSAIALAYELRAMGAGNILTERSRRPMTRHLFMRIAEIYGERFSDPDGRVRATFEFVSLSGWAPHESQPKPLRPGTAKVSLADVLGSKRSGN